MPHALPKLVAFDIDQTLTDTKTPLDAEMADVLSQLARRTNVAVVSGAPLSQCLTQIVEHLSLSPQELTNVFLIPTSGAALYAYDVEGASWRAVYEETLTEVEKKKIFDAFSRVLSDAGMPLFPEDASYGELLEDRTSQVTYSALGANAPLSLKREWDSDFEKRKQLVAVLAPLLPEFTLSMGGTTSIDVTRSGISKALGLFRLTQHLGLHPQDVLYVGDALFSGGNDASLTELGVETLSVGDPGLEDTKEAIRGLLARAG